MGDGSGETPEEELLDLLTCHRSDSQMHDWYIVLILCFIYSTYMLDLQHKPRSTKASEGPYAWESALEINSAFRASTKRTQNGDIKCAAACPSVRPCSRSLDKVSTWWALFPSSLTSTPGKILQASGEKWKCNRKACKSFKRVSSKHCAVQIYLYRTQIIPCVCASCGLRLLHAVPLPEVLQE